MFEDIINKDNIRDKLMQLKEQADLEYHESRRKIDKEVKQTREWIDEGIILNRYYFTLKDKINEILSKGVLTTDILKPLLISEIMQNSSKARSIEPESIEHKSLCADSSALLRILYWADRNEDIREIIIRARHENEYSKAVCNSEASWFISL